MRVCFDFIITSTVRLNEVWQEKTSILTMREKIYFVTFKCRNRCKCTIIIIIINSQTIYKPKLYEGAYLLMRKKNKWTVNDSGLVYIWSFFSVVIFAVFFIFVQIFDCTVVPNRKRHIFFISTFRFEKNKKIFYFLLSCLFCLLNIIVTFNHFQILFIGYVNKTNKKKEKK